MASRYYSVEGIILKRQNHGEADRFVTVFTKEHGKLRFLAKGVRRITSRRAPHLEVFSHVFLFLHRGKTIDTITDVKPIERFETLRKNLERVHVGFFYCELVSLMLPDRQEHPDIFNLLRNAIVGLNDLQETRLYDGSRKFSLELLWGLGFLPRTTKLHGVKLQSFIEQVVEKRLRTPRIMRQMQSG